MSDARKGLGQLGERLAAEALTQAGLAIIARNWRCELGEIDLVAREDETLVLVEVKTRRGREAGTPEQAVDAVKQRKLCALAQAYIDDAEWDGDARIDVVGVELDRAGHLLRLSHWRNAVECW